MVMAATLLLLDAWKLNLAEGLPQGKNPFDETIEQMWIRQWLFYSKFREVRLGHDRRP